MMDVHEDPHRHGEFRKFLNDFRAIFMKTFFLTIRKPGQTIAEIFLAYAFMGLLLAMRYIMDRRYYTAYTLSRFPPSYGLASVGIVGNTTYYYPNNICASTIANNTMNAIINQWPTILPNINVQPLFDLTLSNLNLQSIVAVIQFTNLDSCTSSSTMPDEVKYTLRLQEYGNGYFHAQDVKISPNDYLWKRAPEDFCRDASSYNLYYRFVGIQYYLDMSIIKYVMNFSQDLTPNIYLNHFGCPKYYLDQLHSLYGFFIPIFFSIIFVVTFIINVGYIVEERENKTKEYLRIYGLRTWVNNLVWTSRSMIIYIFLITLMTILSLIILPSTHFRTNSSSKALFNYTHWTVLWTILFVYAIQVSTFAVLFAQFFKRPLLAKLIGFVIWVITFIDYYPGVSVGIRYFLCIFPNVGLMFCLQVILQYERESVPIRFEHLYSNLFSYPLFIGICLLLMLIYSLIYLLLAIYIERINPGEFGVAQSWNYLFKKSYWNIHGLSSIHPLVVENIYGDNTWIELNPKVNSSREPSVIISHLTKKFGKFQAVSDLSLNFYRGEVSSLLGHNGAGKTTTTFILVGMLEPTSGHVKIEGFDNHLHVQNVRKILGFCPQYDILYNELSVEEHLKLIGKMRQMKSNSIQESIESILQLIGLVNDRRTLTKNLSGGMKRRLSIGISLIGDPKVLILDEPTSGIDPYNRRLIWTIIRKMKEADKCIILTTHFLEEADVLSDRIAIMSNGRLQAYGTPNYLKNQIEFEYRLFIDKQETFPNDFIHTFIQRYLPGIVLERETRSEIRFGIRRNESKNIAGLVHALDVESEHFGIDSYGLSMITIEEVFLRLIHEEETNGNNQMKFEEDLANRLFHADHAREQGIRRVFLRISALLIKRFHVLRRQYTFLIGFFLLPILIEILIVSILPTPQQIQASLAQNGRIEGAQITLIPSIYNPQTIVTYTNNNQTFLIDYLENTNAIIEYISNNSIGDYVRTTYLTSEEIFINKYQIGISIYTNLSTLIYNAYFSTVNYHAMATSLTVVSTNLFQFYSNSSSKKILTTNQPILTSTTTVSLIQWFLGIIYCFDTIPVSLFNFLNSILAALFLSILITPLIQERINHSKDLQLLTNLTKRTYWLSNFLFDFLSCLILCLILTIIIKIGSIENPSSNSEVHVYRNSIQTGCFILTMIMYCLASLPLIYVYSFSPRSELIGFINFFVLNIVACLCDMVLVFIALFSQSQSSSAGIRITKLTNIMNIFRTILAIVFPTVNLKSSLFNIRLHSTQDCISAVNGVMLTNYSITQGWLSLHDPGIGKQLVIFCGQMIFWWISLILIETGICIKLACRQCCACDNNDETGNSEWMDTDLDEDVRNERQLIAEENPISAVILVRDLVKNFRKRANLYTAVDHLNFQVPKRSCFGLLGANGAGKTTTFRMLINDLKPTTGEIMINGKNINTIGRDLEIGFCPQFDWLVNNLTVQETLILFARLKGLIWNEIAQICDDMLVLFGLEMYKYQKVQKLSGGTKRKVSAAIAFMANPALVFLDEPTTGLDAAAKRKLWNVLRTARDVGLTIILTSHSMEECEALCTKIGIMKLGQFMCLGNLQRLKNRFGRGYAVQVKLPLTNINLFKEELMLTLPGVQFDEQHNGMLFCTVPFASVNIYPNCTDSRSFNLAHIFDLFEKKKQENTIESYSITQTTLEQIFVHLTGEDQYVNTDRTQSNE